MDSELIRKGRLVFLVDDSWRFDVSTLPNEDIQVPVSHLPDPEPDNGNPSETIKEMELKWVDLALNRISNDSAN